MNLYGFTARIIFFIILQPRKCLVSNGRVLALVQNYPTNDSRICLNSLKNLTDFKPFIYNIFVFLQIVFCVSYIEMQKNDIRNELDFA